jgi:hypothetical protein
MLGRKTYWSVGFEGTLHDDEIINYFFDDAKEILLSVKVDLLRAEYS